MNFNFSDYNFVFALPYDAKNLIIIVPVNLPAISYSTIFSLNFLLYSQHINGDLVAVYHSGGSGAL